MTSFLSNLPTPPRGSSDSSRFTPMTTMVMFLGVLFLVGGTLVACIIYNPTYSQTIIITVVSGQVLVSFHIFGVSELQRTREVLANQISAHSERAEGKLSEMSEKVNGGTDKAISALREQHRIELHDANNRVGNLEMRLELANKEKEQAAKQFGDLKAEFEALKVLLAAQQVKPNVP